MTSFEKMKSYEENLRIGKDFPIQYGSNASDYVYEKTDNEMKSWEVPLSTKNGNVAAGEKQTGFVQKTALIMKSVTIFVDFLMILTAGVIAKGAILFIIAQVCLCIYFLGKQNKRCFVSRSQK